MIVVLQACEARQFSSGQSACTHENNAGRFVVLNECAECPLSGLLPRVEPKTETLRSGNVVRTVPCQGCAGNVRLKVR